MLVSSQHMREFDAGTRAGGDDDFERGLTSLDRIATSAVRFQIANQAQVTFDWKDAGVFCTCPAFQKYPEHCTHVWTALRAFDQSSEPDLVEARENLATPTVKLKRLGLESSAVILREAVDPKEIAQWPIARIEPRVFIEFAGQRLTGFGFEYGPFKVPFGSPRREFYNAKEKQRVKRNLAAEKRLLSKKLDVREYTPAEIRTLVAAYAVTIDGAKAQLLEPEDVRLEEVAGGFFDFIVRFKNGATLGDVTDQSFLPDDLAKRVDILKQGAELTKAGALRFTRTSLPLFKPAFEGVSHISTDALRVFHTLAGLNETGEAVPPTALKASLRHYQAEGLFWLQRMSTSNFGGILADDMGLGKTVQVIAYLLGRKRHFVSNTPEQKPCLVVVPKSLVSNWINEVEKFGPTLRVLDFAGPNRVIFRPQMFDVILTTYHVMKNEIDRLKLTDFDTIILDEAQAIKNPGSQIAKAVFQLRARQRFALSGTPVENSLRDLFSLMRFTNPGLIPATFERLYTDRKSLTLPKHVTEKIASAVRPFILRRTKKQVLKELPDKSEQVLMCEMDAPQKRLYDQTRRHFAMKLKEEGATQTRVFEALLRLRQISCHPALVKDESESTKVEMLLEHLEDIRAAGNKALVFSQFTSFLDLLMPELEKAGIKYEHLDGSTRNRGAVVDRFNGDPKTTVFLISLKAGGTGLNLTTASYVFLMDPWWNPAIESQAIDRAYRMGQKQKVMAYRLIAKGTIEEKILKLQDKKRTLAESLITDTGESLSLEDLEFLLEP